MNSNLLIFVLFLIIRHNKNVKSAFSDPEEFINIKYYSKTNLPLKLEKYDRIWNYVVRSNSATVNKTNLYEDLNNLSNIETVYKINVISGVIDKNITFENNQKKLLLEILENNFNNSNIYEEIESFKYKRTFDIHQYTTQYTEATFSNQQSTLLFQLAKDYHYTGKELERLRQELIYIDKQNLFKNWRVKLQADENCSPDKCSRFEEFKTYQNLRLITPVPPRKNCLQELFEELDEDDFHHVSKTGITENFISEESQKLWGDIKKNKMKKFDRHLLNAKIRFCDREYSEFILRMLEYANCSIAEEKRMKLKGKLKECLGEIRSKMIIEENN